MMSPIAFYKVRQQALEWAMQTALVGESAESIQGRADSYVHYVTEPLRDEVRHAMVERLTAVVH